MLTKKSLEELLCAAEKATPGPWEASHVDSNHKEVTSHSPLAYWVTCDTSRQEDCEYIAAANPETIKHLVQTVLHMQEALLRYSDHCCLCAEDYDHEEDECIFNKAKDCLEKWGLRE